MLQPAGPDFVSKDAGQKRCQLCFPRYLCPRGWLNFCISGVANNVCSPEGAMIGLQSTTPGGLGSGDDELAEIKCCGTRS